MKRSDYFYTFLLLGTIALIVYGFLNFFWTMVGLIALSSVFSFVVFLVQTRVKLPVANENFGEQPIDFYKTDTRTTYYMPEQRKQANAE
jgi:preprotein translocase subunit SecY